MVGKKGSISSLKKGQGPAFTAAHLRRHEGLVGGPRGFYRAWPALARFLRPAAPGDPCRVTTTGAKHEFNVRAPPDGFGGEGRVREW